MDGLQQVSGRLDESGEGMNVDEQGYQGHMSSTRRSSCADARQGRSYKEMLEILKEVVKSSDAVTEQICDLNLKYADLTTKGTMMVDPDVAKILLGEMENYPEVMTASQQTEKMSLKELDQKYAELTNALSQRQKDKESERNEMDQSSPSHQ